jgi:DUF4097 and DUF4098 domain-containing protein YvlB
VLKAAILAVAVAPLLVAGGCSFFSGPIAKGSKNTTATHAPGSPIVVQTQNGGVQIIAESSRSDVRIDAEFTCSGSTQQEADQRLAQAVLEVARDTSRTLTIKSIFPGGVRNNDGASLIIRVPDAVGIDIQTSNGPVSLASLGGALKVRTSNASVTISDHDGPADIQSSNGSVTIRNLGGELMAITSNSGVNASGVKGRADIKTANGSIMLALDHSVAGPVLLHTSNSSITVSVGPAFTGDIQMNTSNGTVTASGDDVKVLRTGNSDGTVHLGDGEQSIIKTSNGSITFAVVK